MAELVSDRVQAFGTKEGEYRRVIEPNPGRVEALLHHGTQHQISQGIMADLVPELVLAGIAFLEFVVTFPN